MLLPTNQSSQLLLCMTVASHFSTPFVFTGSSSVRLFSVSVSEHDKHLAGRDYRSGKEVIAAVEELFRDQDKGCYITGIQGLQHRWRKCMYARKTMLK